MAMEMVLIFKALANEARVKILQGLREPARHFPPQDEGDVEIDGVCVSSIQEGIGLSQSATSDHLAVLNRAGLVKSKRIGQWTYYKRNEELIEKLSASIRLHL